MEAREHHRLESGWHFEVELGEGFARVKVLALATVRQKLLRKIGVAKVTVISENVRENATE